MPSTLLLLLTAAIIGLPACAGPADGAPQGTVATPSTPTAMSLHYLVRRPTAPAERPPLLLLMHGVGSNERDLFSFAEQLPGEYLVVSARAPHVLGPDSYGWYRVDFSTGKPVYDLQQAEESRHTLVTFLGELTTAHPYDPQRVYLCGFSQGGIMAYSVGLTRPDLAAGIAPLSGRLLEEVKAEVKPSTELQRLRVFIGHGTQDPVLPVHYAHEAEAYLRSIGITPVLKTYPAPHTITSEELSDLVHWLKP